MGEYYSVISKIEVQSINVIGSTRECFESLRFDFQTLKVKSSRFVPSSNSIEITYP